MQTSAAWSKAVNSLDFHIFMIFRNTPFLWEVEVYWSCKFTPQSCLDKPTFIGGGKGLNWIVLVDDTLKKKMFKHPTFGNEKCYMIEESFKTSSQIPS